jgi:DNA polymerase-3 subunit epsilon
VSQAPTWPEVRPTVHALLTGKIVASHTYFDTVALTRADLRYGLEPAGVLGWIDTCEIARAAWPYLSNHKLPHVARFLGVCHSPHDARDDARCAGEVLLRGAKAIGLSMDALLDAQSVRFRLSFPSAEPSILCLFH